MVMRKEASYEMVNFMIVDDDDVSIKSLQRSIKALNIANPVFVAKDGSAALELLRDTVGESRSLPPFIVTLDLNMPRMDGLEFLEEIRKDQLFRKLVVFVLTTSDSPRDVASAYEQNVAGYIVKENPTESLHQALKLLDGYAQIVVLPT